MLNNSDVRNHSFLMQFSLTPLRHSFTNNICFLRRATLSATQALVRTQSFINPPLLIHQHAFTTRSQQHHICFLRRAALTTRKHCADYASLRCASSFASASYNNNIDQIITSACPLASIITPMYARIRSSFNHHFQILLLLLLLLLLVLLLLVLVLMLVLVLRSCSCCCCCNCCCCCWCVCC